METAFLLQFKPGAVRGFAFMHWLYHVHHLEESQLQQERMTTACTQKHMGGKESETESDRTRARDRNRDIDRGMTMRESLDPGSSEISYGPMSLSYKGMYVLSLFL